MADEEVVFGLRYVGQGQTADLINDLGRVGRGVSELNGLQLQAPGSSILESLSSTLRQQFSTLDIARGRLEIANEKARELADKIALTQEHGFGQKVPTDSGGTVSTFASERAQRVARIQSEVGVGNAAKAVEREYQRYRSVLEQAARAQQSLAQVGQIVSRGLSEEATAGTQAARGTVDAAALQRRLNSAIQQRIRADEQESLEAAKAAAAASRLASVDAELAAARPTTYQNPDATSHLGVAQSRVNAAEINAELTARKLSDERTSLTRTYESVRRAEQAAERASQNLTSAQDQLALLEKRQSGGFSAQFATGFRGTNADRPYAEQLGQAFKFSVLYGSAYRILFGITQTLSAALQEGIAFEQAMTELAVASGQTKDSLSDVARQLGDASVQAGFAPSQGVLVGARSLGLFGAAAGSGTQADQQAYIAEISSRVVSRIAMGSGMQPADIQTNIAAIANAFGAGPEGQIRAYDLDAYLSRKFGVGQGATLAPVSESATVGQAAGFSQEQITAIAADLIARTGQTPEAVSGYMAQIFSRAGEGALGQVDQRYGVNAQAPLAEQLAKLSNVYAAHPEARDDISAAFGRGKVQNAVIALLQDFQNVQQEAHKATRGATGEGDRQFQLRMSNIGGQVELLQGSLKDFADALGQSGMLETLGVLVVMFRHMVEVGTELLRTWGALPATARRIIETLGSLLLITRVATGGNLLTSAGRATAMDYAIAGEGEHRGTGFLSNNIKGMGLAALVLGDTYLWGSFRDSTRKLTDAQGQYAQALENAPKPGATPDQLRSYASGLSSLATQDRSTAGGLFERIVGSPLGLSSVKTSDLQAQAASSDAEAKRLNALAAYEDRAAKNATASQVQVTGFDSTSLSSSMQAITDAGGTARDQLEALRSTLIGTAGAAARASSAFDPYVFAGENAGPLANRLASSVYLGQRSPDSGFHNPFTHNPFTPVYKTTNVGDDRIRAVLPPSLVASRLRGTLQSLGTPIGDLTGREMRDVANTVLQDTAQKAFGDKGPEQVAAAQKMLRRALVKYLKKQADDAKALVSGTHRLSSTELTSYVDNLVQSSQQLADSLPQNDFSGRIRVAQQLVRDILSAIGHSKDGATAGAIQQLDAARRAVAEAQITRLESLRRAAQHMAKTDAEVKSIGRSYFNRELARAVQGRDSDALVGLINNAGNWSISLAKKAIQDAIAVIRASINTETQIRAFQASEIAGIKGMIGQVGATGGGPSAGQKHQLDQLHEMLQALSTALPAGQGNAYDTGSDANRPPKPPKDKTPGPTAAQIAAARQSAYAAGSESQISQARAAMATARADMAAAKKGTVEYYQALGAYLQARNQLTDAIVAFHENLFLLHHDATDPVVQAEAAVRAAAVALRADAGKPADVRAADRVALQQTQAQVEAARFQKRLDAAQTAEQLGRTSHRAYINYLDNEHDRLKSITHRTYQQQQELNQIDQLLQQAAQSMQGVWNFGDIQLPKPYQVKRSIEDKYGLGVGGGTRIESTTHNTITIDGADTRMVIKTIRDVLGGNLLLETAKPRKR